MIGQNRFTLKANYYGNNPRIRQGCKAILVGGFNGDGFVNRKYMVLDRNGKRFVIWLNVKSLTSFRQHYLAGAAFKLIDDTLPFMSRDEAAALSEHLNSTK